MPTPFRAFTSTKYIHDCNLYASFQAIITTLIKIDLALTTDNSMMMLSILSQYAVIQLLLSSGLHAVSGAAIRGSIDNNARSSRNLQTITGPLNATGKLLKVGWTSGATQETFTSTGDDAFIITSNSVGDIYGTSDRFHYLYFNQTGDVAVTCLVKSLNGTHSWRKGGIMFRKNLGPRSANAAMIKTGGGTPGGSGFSHQRRLTEGAATEVWNIVNYQAPNVWLRLVKTGNTITSYFKKDGDLAWMRYLSTDVDLGSQFYIGIAVSANSDPNAAKLTVEKFKIADTSRGDGLMMDMIGVQTTPSWSHSAQQLQWSMAEVKREDIIWAKVPAGQYSINATGGTGIGGTADDFAFVQQEFQGDVTASLHVEKVSRRNKLSRGGLMIRASHAVDAAHVSLLIDVDRGVTMVYRTATGGVTENKNLGVWSENVDFNLVKLGNSVRCQYKPTGASEWVEMGSVTADFGSSFYVGQALASGENGQLIQLMSGAVVVERSLTANRSRNLL